MSTTRQRPEEQFVMPVEASRRGAHRARVHPVLGVLPMIAVAGVVIGVVMLAWTLFSGAGPDQTASPVGVVASATTSADPNADADGGAQSPAPSASSSAATEKEPTQEPAKTAAPAAVDKDLKVTVRNSTKIKGLAAGAATKLKAEGWTINGTPDNFSPTINSTVFYAEPAQKASALAVAQVLGIDLVKENADRAPKGITAVLGPDYQR